MPVFYETVNVKLPKIKRRLVSQWIKTIAGSFQKKTESITYIFCDDEEILRINKLYLEHDYYTDIITFDYSEDNQISGDLFISLDTVRSNADVYHVDYEEELLRVIIHGILHLCGLKDKTPVEEAEMRKQEDKALAVYKEYLAIK
ncbi:rRNA maturation RNase YbeY [Bacteroidales bacterium OttesenSCG-928-A17]|nr:rRNA maturation RNase YbeY [Bacteroidales bacterium OttesenSCG-928-A17]